MNLLFRTYPNYHDRASRQAVQLCLRAFLKTKTSDPIWKYTVQFFGKETQKQAIASSNAFVLVEWGSLLLEELAQQPEKFDKYGLDIVSADARALSLCMGTAAKEGVKHSALVVTRRALRAILASDSLAQNFVQKSVARLVASSSTSRENAPFLGVIAGVCSRQSKHRHLVEQAKKEYFTFYTKDILGSRTAVPQHVLLGLEDFFASFVSMSDIEKDVVPTLEKAILRAPEVIFTGIIPALCSALPAEVDMTQSLQSRLIKPILSSLKSTNVVVRNGAMDAFVALLSKSANEDLVSKMVDEILVPIKTSKVPNADQRTLQVQMLKALPATKAYSATIVTGLCLVAAKEPNEQVLDAEAATICHHSHVLAEEESKELETAFAAFLKGFADKKPTVKKIWILHSSELIWALEESTVSNTFVSKLLTQYLTKFFDTFADLSANPLPYSQNGTVSIGFAATALFCKLQPVIENKEIAPKFTQVIDQSLSTSNSKISFLVNPRIYTKLSAKEDIAWAIRAFSFMSKSTRFQTIDDNTGYLWAQAFIFFISASEISSQTQNSATTALAQTYLSNPLKVGKFIIGGLWQWLLSLQQADKEAAANSTKSGNSKLYLVIRSIMPRLEEIDAAAGNVSEDTLKEQLISLLVLCRDNLLPRASWINTALGVGIDPGDLVAERPAEFMSEVIEKVENPPQSELDVIQDAASSAAADLAFVAPEAVVPKLIKQIASDLSPAHLAKFGPTEAAIARTPEGTAFIDVLNTKGKGQLEDKNIKDYDTLKWEAELKAQLAAKKGQQKKLTADEQAKVKAQLAKEAGIRQEVQLAVHKIKRGCSLVTALAKNQAVDPSNWINYAIGALLRLAQASAGLFVGDAVSQAYLACSERAAQRLGSLRLSVGLATLRADGSTYLDAELEEENLGDLITRVLYRLRFSAEQRPFDMVSFSYILPLVFSVLQKGGIGKSAGDEADEQVLLALEFLSFHTEACSDSRLPRKEILSSLLTSMQKYTQHYKLVKDTLVNLCRDITATIQPDELQILLNGAIVPETSVRSAVLQAIDAEIDLTDLEFSEQIWIECHDSVAENAELASTIWQENDLEADQGSPDLMLTHIENPDSQLRNAAARALAHSVQIKPSTFGQTLDTLQAKYAEAAKPKVPERDAYGMVKKAIVTDDWEVRSGIALSFRYLADLFESNRIVPFMDFLIQGGALADRNATVRRQVVESGTTLIAQRGQEKVEELMKLFESTLETSDKASEQSDWINEAVIVLYGSLARHLKKGDSRIQSVIEKLLNALSTPSETVQFAVAECIPPLIQLVGAETGGYVQRLMDELFQSKKYAARRGAAYGLAGIVRGKGVNALKEFRIMTHLRSATEDKKDPNHRQGALLAYELFATILGRVFEPYIIQSVPQLLTSFGDPSIDVREACLDAAKACFANLSSFGVQQILPVLLEGLDEPQWRSKKGACELLGAMAYLDPQQLAISLPEIIPSLTEVLNDSHKEVRSAANRSLQRFGEVISNPEVKSLVNVLLKALSDPTKYTDEALDALIKVNFVHYLDAPSLALVVRILERGLSDRSATKKKSAQIIGSLAHLTERKDLTSHLPILVAGLKVAIVDPVPTTRATASKALGSLIEKLGEDALPDLIPSLMSTLKSDTGAGDRLGSAQALSEVLAGLGTSRLEESLPSILQNVASSKPSVREGFMSLFIFLPACFGNSFANYLSKIIPSILAGLADEIEAIRETALRAGRLLVKNFATKSIDLLLPELERGLANDSHRIRLSSVELVGDLLFNLTGISATADAEDEEEDAAKAGQSLLEVLGEDRRNKVLSALYICRCDTSGLVRTAAINVWKALVASPRTLKDLVPTLSQFLIKRLASSNPEQKVIAGNALGELIRKAGEGVLSTLLPTLEEGLQTSTDVDAREGICIALREIITSAAPETLEDYEKVLISVVRVALVDQDTSVREAAAEAFDSLQRILGKRAIDQVLPYLLKLLQNDEDAQQALSALLTLLTEATRANIILPNLIPTLLTPPITSFNAKALASLAEVAGPAMSRRLPNILNSLMDSLLAAKSDDEREELDSAFNVVLISVDEFDGLNTAMSTMLAMVKHNDHRRRANAAAHLARFFDTTEVDYSRYHQDLIRVLLLSFDDPDTTVVKNAWTALSKLTTHLRKEEMESLVVPTRQVLQQVGVPGHNLAGFGLPKGINAILPIFLQGLINGTSDQRTSAALAISDIIDRTGPDSLKPFVTQMTGPLIRVMSERSVDVKGTEFHPTDFCQSMLISFVAASLFTLNRLLETIPAFLKPFLPQMQRTFAKSLADTSSETLRIRAAKALGTLMPLTPRVDPLIAGMFRKSYMK